MSTDASEALRMVRNPASLQAVGDTWDISDLTSLFLLVHGITVTVCILLLNLHCKTVYVLCLLLIFMKWDKYASTKLLNSFKTYCPRSATRQAGATKDLM